MDMYGEELVSGKVGRAPTFVHPCCLRHRRDKTNFIPNVDVNVYITHATLCMQWCFALTGRHRAKGSEIVNRIVPS